MKCEELILLLQELAPDSYACDWDNVGLLIGDKEKEIDRIYIALDATDEVVEEAVRVNADLLLTHHPLIFSGMKNVREDDFIGRRVRKMIREDMCYYAAHTSFDVAKMAELSAEYIDIIDRTPLENIGFIDGKEQGIGRVGNLKRQMSVLELCKLVKERFELTDVKVFGDLEQMVTRVAISPGSGKSEIGYAVESGAKVLITGDIDHHDGIDAVAKGLTIIDAGHYGLEHIFVPYMKHYLEEKSSLEIFTREHISPFQIV